MIGLYAFKKLSLGELRKRCEEYEQLPLRDKQVLMTYAVTAALIVGILVGSLVWMQLSRSAALKLEPLDRLGLLIELVR